MKYAVSADDKGARSYYWWSSSSELEQLTICKQMTICIMVYSGGTRGKCTTCCHVDLIKSSFYYSVDRPQELLRCSFKDIRYYGCRSRDGANSDDGEIERMKCHPT